MLEIRNKMFLKKAILISLTCLLTQIHKKVHAEEYIYGSESSDPVNNIYGSDVTDEENNCQSNDLPGSIITPELYGNIQLQALRSRLWRILSSPNVNENMFLPNYESLSDGKLLYDITSQNGGQPRNWWHPNFKRNIGAILKSKTIPHALKKSIATLAKNGQLPTTHLPEDEIVDEEEVKRNIASLAKSRTLSQYLKRSLQALAKNSHFPDNKHNEDVENYYEYNLDHMPVNRYSLGKRNIGSLARSGELQNYHKNSVYDNKRNIQYVMKNGGVTQEGKRNIVSLIRNHNMPEMPKEEKSENEKRNIGAIAREWALPNHSTGWNKNSEEKRNLAGSLLQDSSAENSGRQTYPMFNSEYFNRFDLKRNLASIKVGKREVKRSANGKDASGKGTDRHKRQADEYFTENTEDYNPVLHKSNGNDYDELVRMFAGDYFYNQKRFLGNIPLSRMTELGKISLMSQPHVSNATPTSPTYRRKQYLLSRTIPVESEEK